MRRVSKQRPPINVSPDGQISRSFSAARREYLGALPRQHAKASFARSEFDKLDKFKLRKVMYREQRSICVFCERKIEEGLPDPPRIDHWKPLSVHHDLALEWKNLYLSCATKKTCDRAKGDNALRCEEQDPDLPWPAEFSYENYLGFTGGGKIYIRADINVDDFVRRALALAIEPQPRGTGYRQSILNLNDRVLVAARFAAIEAERERLEREFRGRTATKAERKQRAAALLREKEFQAFVSVRVAWLRQTCGHGA
jgi:uncharacterized protein (TIGR02646 family)